MTLDPVNLLLRTNSKGIEMNPKVTHKPTNLRIYVFKKLEGT